MILYRRPSLSTWITRCGIAQRVSVGVSMECGWMTLKIATVPEVLASLVLSTAGKQAVWQVCTMLRFENAICFQLCFWTLFFFFFGVLFCIFLINNRRLYPDQCLSNPNEKHACKWDTPQDQQVSNEATQMCERILKDEKFEKCRKVCTHMDQNICALWYLLWVQVGESGAYWRRGIFQ